MSKREKLTRAGAGARGYRKGTGLPDRRPQLPQTPADGGGSAHHRIGSKGPDPVGAGVVSMAAMSSDQMTRTRSSTGAPRGRRRTNTDLIMPAEEVA